MPMVSVSNTLTWSESPTMEFKNLESQKVYTLEVERPSAWSDEGFEKSILTYRADKSGRINTANQPADVDALLRPYLPFQTMKFKEGATDVVPGKVSIRLIDDSGSAVLEHTVSLGPDLGSFAEDALSSDFPGAFIIKKAGVTQAQPALVILGGSEGGDSSARAQAPLFAEQGFTVLGLPYYSPAWFGQKAQIPELPRAFAELPIDYLEGAVTTLRKRPDIESSSISLLGGSKGAEFVLLAGALIPDYSSGGGFCSIVADVPSDVVWEGWGRGTDGQPYSGFSWRGEALPFVPYVEMSKALNARRTGSDYTMTDAHENGLKTYPDTIDAARIDVEAIDEPVMVIGGDKDTTWASGRMARSIAETRKQRGLRTDVYVYPEGGHRVGGTPFARLSEPNLRARLDNYPAMMAFIRENAERKDCRK